MTAVAADVPDRPRGAARVLHTSDWHLGVTVRGESRAPDHDAVIAEIVDIARAAEPDLILHTGDLFDGHRPPMLEFGRAIRALRALEQVAPVALLAGNHDSPVTLSVLALAVGDEHEQHVVDGTFAPDALVAGGVRVHARPTVAEKGAVTRYATRSGGSLRLVALPFVHQNRVLTSFGDLVEANATYNDALRKIVGSYSDACFDDFDPAVDVAVFASHVHVRDARTSTEKTIHIAEDYATDPAHFESRYGYLAFGHIHVPQTVADGRGRYAGSILEVDFGEEGERKQVVVADLVAGRPTRLHEIALTAGRRLRRVRCPIFEVASHADVVGNDLVEVTVVAETSDELSLFDPLAGFDSLSVAVASMLPDATVVGVIDARVTATSLDDVVSVDGDAASIGDVFRSWLGADGASVVAAQGGGVAVASRVAEMFDELHAAVALDAPDALSELDELAARSSFLEDA